MINLELYIEKGGSYKTVIKNYDKLLTRIYGGFFLKNWGRKEQKNCKQWEDLFLLTDEGNKSDCFAIKIVKYDNGREIKLGYLKKELSSNIESLEDYKCFVYQEHEEWMFVGSGRFGIPIVLKKIKWKK